ncbi:MAG: tRNA (pseudouridine(54)-N(1))-methyltransferase TrmY [Candidatus Aenigmatarchaeota archaeon]
MRTFVLYARKAWTSPKFRLGDLIGAGRMDLVCRCISSALWLSHKAREDARIYVVLNGPPNPPVTICFQGSEYSKVYVDEITNAKWIKSMLSLQFGKDWVEFEGTKIARKSFQEVLTELGGKNYVLHEKGEFIDNVKLDQKPIIILGDQIGLPRAEEGFALRNGGEKISLGKNVYLASSCISILNWVCDKQGI